jgi:hypothetical protein
MSTLYRSRGTCERVLKRSWLEPKPSTTLTLSRRCARLLPGMKNWPSGSNKGTVLQERRTLVAAISLSITAGRLVRVVLIPFMPGANRKLRMCPANEEHNRAIGLSDEPTFLFVLALFGLNPLKTCKSYFCFFCEYRVELARHRLGLSL